MSSSMNAVTGVAADQLARAREKKELAYAKKGLVLALLSGMIWSFDGLALGEGLSHAPFTLPVAWMLAPLLAAGIHDLCAALFCFGWNAGQGRAREVFRTLVSRPGRLCVLGALFGSPLGMGGYLMGVSLAGPAYTLPITSLYPAIAAVLAAVFLRERISRRAWVGLALCVAGGIVIGYTPPETDAGSTYFYLGIAFAVLAAFGWAAEGVCVTSGMDLAEPAVALCIRQFTSAILYALFIVPGVALYLSAGQVAFSPAHFLGDTLSSAGLLFIMLAGVIGCTSYLCWYPAMNMTGVSRAMSLNITYSLWGVLFSALFTDIDITRNLVMGSVIIFAGMFLVIGNPRDIINLRNVD